MDDIARLRLEIAEVMGCWARESRLQEQRRIAAELIELMEAFRRARG